MACACTAAKAKAKRAATAGTRNRVRVRPHPRRLAGGRIVGVGAHDRNRAGGGDWKKEGALKAVYEAWLAQHQNRNMSPKRLQMLSDRIYKVMDLAMKMGASDAEIYAQMDKAIRNRDRERNRAGGGPSATDRREFKAFCAAASDRQIVFEKEKAANRRAYTTIAYEEMRRRGLT